MTERHALREIEPRLSKPAVRELAMLSITVGAMDRALRVFEG